MRCKTARNMISEALGDTLGPDQAEKLERHLSSCAECRGLREDFRMIVRDAGRLEIPAPSDRVWQGIKTRMDETRQKALAKARPVIREKRPLFGLPLFSPAYRFVAVGFLAVAVVAAGVVFSLRGFRSGAPTALDKSMNTTLAKLEEAQRYYKLALKALDEAIAAQKGDLDPRIEQAFLRNREAVEASVAVCEETVAGRPSDIDVRNLLLSAYQEKLDLLNDLMAAKKTSLKRAAGPIL